jgi:membrane-bound metal-dependent hydrolase YbcI (DUF457 family)
MPDFKTHLIAGVLVGIIFAVFAKDYKLAIIGAVYSMIPDLDLNTSYSFKCFLIAACIFAIYNIIAPQDTMTSILSYEFPQRYLAIPPLAFLIFLQMINHREFLHSIVSGLLFSLPLVFYAGQLAVVVGILGYYSHLFLDHELFDGWLT